MDDLIRAVQKMVGPIMRQIRMTVGRCILTLIDDAHQVQTVQLSLLAAPDPAGGTALELNEGVEVYRHYGFTSVPFPGADAVYLSVMGIRTHGVVIATEDRRYRLQGLANGEVALYDDLGQKVHLTRAGIVVHTPLLARVEAADIELHASHSYSWDVNGFGERWTFLGGTTWEHKTWQQGATVTAVNLPINPPEGP